MVKASSILLFIIVIGSISLHGQSYRSYIKAGDQAYKQQNYSAATFYYSKANNLNTNAASAYKLAEAARLNRDYPLAEHWYKYVTENTKKNFPLATFWLAYVQKTLGLYQKAQLNFRNYYYQNRNSKDYYTLKARHEILSCENALFLTFSPDTINFSLLDTIVNTPYSEFEANNLGDSLLFVTALKPVATSDSIDYRSRIFSFKWDNEWVKQPYTDSIFNIAESHTSSISFNKYYTKAFLSICNPENGRFHCKIYQSEKNGDQWSTPKPLEQPVNLANYSSSQPNYIQTDTCDILLFASDRPGGEGKYDLWYSILGKDGFKDPVNLGKRINSIDDEICPFFDSQNNILYFSSEWYDNLGGFDIFRANGNFEYWSVPENLGYPLNSGNHDVYYTQATSQSYAYFSSNRSQKTGMSSPGCCNDLYQIKLPEKHDSGEISEKRSERLQEKSRELIPISLFFHNDEPNPRTYDTTTTLTYPQTINKYIALTDEYVEQWSKPLTGDTKLNAMAEIENFFIDSVENNYNKLLKFMSMMEELLANGEHIEITIKGFASPLNNNQYNTNLSKRRIQSLVNFFYQYNNGILLPYLENSDSTSNQLVIHREAFGEDMVSKNVSDNLFDLRSSVYSPAAACERKIAVIAVSFGKD